MTGKGHQAVGFVLTIPCCFLIHNIGFSYILGLLCSLGAVFGAKAPDYLEIPYGLGKNRKTILRHRGITHWWVIWFLPLVVLYSFVGSVNGYYNIIYQYLKIKGIDFLFIENIEYVYIFFIGYLLSGLFHIITDLPNKKGMPLFLPFSSFCLYWWKSGEYEKTITSIFIFGSGLYVYYSIYNTLPFISNLLIF